MPTLLGPPNVAGLAGLRKDGSIFPVRISLSSVPTATGRFTLALIRDYSAALLTSAASPGPRPRPGIRGRARNYSTGR